MRWCGRLFFEIPPGVRKIAPDLSKDVRGDQFRQLWVTSFNPEPSATEVATRTSSRERKQRRSQEPLHDYLPCRLSRPLFLSAGSDGPADGRKRLQQRLPLLDLGQHVFRHDVGLLTAALLNDSASPLVGRADFRRS